MAMIESGVFLMEGDKEKRICRYGLFLILAVTMLSFLYKAHYTGVAYDEAMTFRDYCDSVHTARHNFKSTNNHVLNSILIHYAHRLFGGYEHFIRIFPMLSGLLFFAAIAFLLTRMLRCPWLWLVGLVLIFTVRMVFNYLLMARGYTYGLSAMVLYGAVVFYFMQRPTAFKRCWIPIVLLSVLNFLALSSMLSAVFVMVALNAVFVLLFCPRLYQPAVSKVKAIVIHAVSIASLSGILLFLFYRPILSDVLHADQNEYVADIAKSWKGWPSYTKYLNNLLNHEIFDAAGAGRWLAPVFFVVLAVVVLWNVIRLVQSVRQKQVAAGFNSQKYGLFIGLVFSVYFVILFIYSVLLKRSPGLLRSQVFMIPFLLMSFLWLLDNSLKSISKKALRGGVLVVCCVLLGMIGYHDKPKLRSINKGGAAISRPTLKRLQALDPDATWNIAFSQKMRYSYMGFIYYKQFGYKFNLNTGQYSNVLISRPGEAPKGAVCLDYDYFLHDNKCIVSLLKPGELKHAVLEVRSESRAGQ